MINERVVTLVLPQTIKLLHFFGSDPSFVKWVHWTTLPPGFFPA